MPAPFANEVSSLPRKGSATSWASGGEGSGNESHPTAVTEWGGRCTAEDRQ